MSGTKQHLELEVCLRPFAPEEIQHRQREILDRVEAVVASQGDEVGVVWWSPKVAMPDDGPFAGSIPDVVGELLALAERDGFSLAPFIEEHDAGGSGHNDVLVLPLVSLVVRVDGEIRGLYPVEIDGKRYDIEDGIQALEAGETATNLDGLPA